MAGMNGRTSLLKRFLGYNSIGNIESKSDVGAYSYPASGTNSVRPHAVTQAGSSPIYQYDANGNVTSRNGSSIAWTSFNLPSQINSGSNYSQFTYGPDRQRWKHVANSGGTLETTISIGGLFDKVTRPSVTDYRHYIPVDGGSVIRTLRSNGTSNTYYSSSDHLGSSDAITNESGAIIVRESFGAFGARRGSNWTGVPTSPEMNQIAESSLDGFTGHEMLDSVGLVHMNGRVYDQTIGRFISADPYVQNPFDSQSLNRYSYVGNNPLSYTDPSGFFSLRDFFDPSSKNNPHRWISPGAYATPYIDRFMIKNPKIAAYIGGMLGGWLGLGVNAHLVRINGGGPFDIIAAGVLSFYFGGGGYEYSMGGGFSGPGGRIGLPTGVSGGTGWVTDHGIAGATRLSPELSERVESGPRTTPYGNPYLVNIEPPELARLRAASPEWRAKELEVWQMSLPRRAAGRMSPGRPGRYIPAVEHRLFVIQHENGSLRFVIGSASINSPYKMHGSVRTNPRTENHRDVPHPSIQVELLSRGDPRSVRRRQMERRPRHMGRY
jgi:RHS repeat-associated protein